MKKLFTFMAMLFALSVMTISAQQTETVQVGFGTERNEVSPVCNWWKVSYSGNENIYLKNDLGLQAGDKIVALSFYCISGSGSGGNFNVRLKNTLLDRFESNAPESDDVSILKVGYNDKVYANVSLGSYSAGDWITFNFSEPFVYEGENIILDIRNTAPSTRQGWCYFAATNSNNARREIGWRNANSENVESDGFHGVYAFGSYDSGFWGGLSDDNCAIPNVIITYIPAETITVSEFTAGGLCYKTNSDGKSVSVTYSDSSNDYAANYAGLTAANIPETVSYQGKSYSVTGIEANAFQNCFSLKSATVPNSATTIGASAFRNCVSMTSVNIGNSLSSIGDYAFIGCTDLMQVNISDLAAWCNIDFYGYNSNPLSFAHNLYLNGSKVTNLVVPNTVTTIKSYAFRGCTSLTSVTIPNSVKMIGASSFRGCTGLTSVNIGNSVSVISNHAFNGCTGLTSVNLPNSMEVIGADAFNGCSSLTAVTLGNSVVSIGNAAFNNCTGLTQVNISDLTAWCNIDFGGLFSNPLFYSHNLYLNGNKVTNLIIPGTVKTIKNYAFRGCSGLTSVIIPSSVDSIGMQAFDGCTGLTSIYSKIMDPESVNYESDIFNNVPTSTCVLYVPNSKREIYRTIAPWSNFSYIIGRVYDFKVDGLCYNLNADGTSVTVTYEFEGEHESAQGNGIGNPDLSGDLVIPSSVDYGGKTYSVTVIGTDAFYNCSGLTSVTIPNSVTSIGLDAFWHCTGLTDVEIPNSVISLNGFSGCTGLTSVTIPNSVTTIGNHAFRSCSGLTSVKISGTVTTIGQTAFYGCTSLTSVTIPNSVTSIGQAAFYGCTSLSTVTIGNSVTLIGAQAFRNCTNLSSIYSKIEDPKAVTYKSNIFYNVPTSQCSLFIPHGTLDSYSTTNPWKNFNIIEMNVYGDVNGDENITAADITELYNYLLNNDMTYQNTGDINGDGQITAADITAVYDVLLGTIPSEPSEVGITEYSVNGVTFRMVEVSGGMFTMGATEEQASDAYDREKPVHEVTLSSFSIGETEVTQELWKAVMGSNPSKFNGGSYGTNLQRPVECVSWDDCQQFIAKLNQMTGKSFRLPTEAEWEYAARGGNLTNGGYKYSGSDDVNDVAWCWENSGSQTRTVATKSANELGLYDMSGNVWEWCQDYWGYYSNESQTNPTGPASGSEHIIRGGSYDFNNVSCRVSERRYGVPFRNLGFRLAQ